MLLNNVVLYKICSNISLDRNVFVWYLFHTDMKLTFVNKSEFFPNDRDSSNSEILSVRETYNFVVLVYFTNLV